MAIWHDMIQSSTCHTCAWLYIVLLVLLVLRRLIARQPTVHNYLQPDSITTRGETYIEFLVRAKTHVLIIRTNSNECSLQISKSEECCQRQMMRSMQATSALFNWPSLQTVERTNSPVADAVNSFLLLPSPTTFFLLATFAGVAAFIVLVPCRA